MSYVHIGLYNTLRSLGATEDQAQAAVVDLPAPQHLAFKEDLLQAIAGVNDRIGQVETGIANLRADIKAEIANEFKGLYRFLLVTAVSIIAVIVGILKLFP